MEMKPFRSKKLTDSAKDVCCIRCARDSETRASHFNGPMQHRYGKGRGQKGNDLMTAEFCGTCDAEFSEGHMPTWIKNDPGLPGRIAKQEARDAEFLHWISMTNIRRIERGVLKVA